MQPTIVCGDLLDQPVDAIVNKWNRNIIPWWLLLPQGVAGAIKRRGGYRPFIELGRQGAIPLGGAVLTSVGRLPFRGIVHAAGISMCWRASPLSVQGSVRAAMAVAAQQGFRSIAFPVLRAGVSGYSEDEAMAMMLQAFEPLEYSGTCLIVRFRPAC